MSGQIDTDLGSALRATMQWASALDSIVPPGGYRNLTQLGRGRFMLAQEPSPKKRKFKGSKAAKKAARMHRK